MTVASEPRIQAYRSGDEYFLRIDAAVSDDSGLYTILIDHLDQNATVAVKVNEVKSETKEHKCIPGQKACQSGHCLPKNLFCDGYVHCPDGDDEMNCSGLVLDLFSRYVDKLSS